MKTILLVVLIVLVVLVILSGNVLMSWTRTEFDSVFSLSYTTCSKVYIHIYFNVSIAMGFFFMIHSEIWVYFFLRDKVFSRLLLYSLDSLTSLSP